MQWDISAECVSALILNIIMIYSWRSSGSVASSPKNRAFRACLFVTYLSIVTNVFSALLLEYLCAANLWINRMLLLLNYIFTPLMGMVYYFYTIATVFEDDPVQMRHHLILSGIPALLYIGCVLLNPWTHLLFHIPVSYTHLADGFASKLSARYQLYRIKENRCLLAGLYSACPKGHAGGRRKASRGHPLPARY